MVGKSSSPADSVTVIINLEQVQEKVKIEQLEVNLGSDVLLVLLTWK